MPPASGLRRWPLPHSLQLPSGAKPLMSLGGPAASIFEAQQAIVLILLLEASVFSKVDDGVPLLQAVNEAIATSVDGLEASDGRGDSCKGYRCIRC